MVEFEESGMEFSFPDERCFHIEKSKEYRKLGARGIRTVECIYCSNRRYVFFIEAKSSAPRDNEGLKEYLDRLYEKNLHSILMLTKRIFDMEKAGIGNELWEKLRNKPVFRFVLIIKGFREDWCMDIQEVFRDKMKNVLRIYDADVLVINDEAARKKKWIKEQ